jgi:hypothetical protein
VLALDTSTTAPFAADNALEVKSLDVNLAHAHRRLRGHIGARDPHGTAQVHPFVEGLSQYCFWTFKSLLIPLQEESIVFRNFGYGLTLQKVEVHVVLREGLPRCLGLHDERLLKVSLAAQDLGQCVVLVFAFEELQA